MIVKGCAILPGQTGHAAGRALLAELYREYTGRELPAIAVAPRGKPYFANDDLQFSITHTKSHVFCVLAQTPVGIDAEELNRKVNPLLADKILSPKEREEYDRAEDPQKALLTFWVLKEAAAKCSGQGLRGYPKDTEFSLQDPRVTEINGCLVAVITENAE